MTQADRRVAVIGMSGRFPGCQDVLQFWSHLVEGRTGIKDVLPRPESKLPQDPNYVAKAATVEQADCFDGSFFGVLPKLAQEMDPQHRLFLECSWNALEDAGYRPDKTPGRVGVFAGCHMNTYIFLRLADDSELRQSLADSFPGGNLNAEILNDKDYLATRIAYHLNLRGPAVTIQTACSTSLVAIAQACDSLIAGSSDMALAGGVCITFPQEQGYLHTEDSIISPDGVCRTFDAEAKGTVFGDGVGVVVLKRLVDAQRDGDNILAVIKGWAVNNDGGEKGGYTAPSVSGQVAAIAQAHQSAGISADTISYVEAHGTATLVGDPIEIAALTEAFRLTTNKNQFCAIGSLKSNFGHLDVAAGVAALIKVTLALHHRKIPASLNFRSPNPRIDFENSPFYVQTSLADWIQNPSPDNVYPRRAGVSSFGVGGTNAHLILEEYIEPNKCPSAFTGQVEDSAALDNSAGATQQSLQSPEHHFGPELFLLSAQSDSALLRMKQDWTRFCRTANQSRFPDAALTSRLGRKPCRHRLAIVANDFQELADSLSSNRHAQAQAARPQLVFAFPGQGSQHLGMAQNLYLRDQDFAFHFDQAIAALQPHVGLDLRDVIFGKSMNDLSIDQTIFAQPAIFAVSYALARWLQTLGFNPNGVIGHSVGEFAAATIAGIVSLQDGARLIASRGSIMQNLPAGAMLAVYMDLAQLANVLPEGLEIAAMNAPTLNVVAGPNDLVDRFQQDIEQGRFGADIECRRLRTSHAFHSAMMDDAIGPFSQVVEQCSLSTNTIPFWSTVTGSLLGKQATSVDYWSHQIRRPVQFSQTVQALTQQHPQNLFIEVGPGQALTTLIKQHALNPKNQFAIPLLPHAKNPTCDQKHALAAVGQAWCHGAEIVESSGWKSLRSLRRTQVPTYSFDRTRHWFTTNSHTNPEAPNSPTEPRALLPTLISSSRNNQIQQLVATQMIMMQRQLELLKRPKK